MYIDLVNGAGSNSIFLYSYPEISETGISFSATFSRTSNFQELGLPLVCQRTRTPITAEMLQQIKKRKDNGETVNFIAKHERISESAIRYALKKNADPTCQCLPQT